MSTNNAHTSQTVVTTKYYGPTNTRGSRVKVTTHNGSKFVPFDSAAGWGGINEAGVAKVTAELLMGEYATNHGDEYVITEVTPVGGPEADVRYWIVTYAVTYG